MAEHKAKNFRENFPGYMGHIPYKKEVIGMTVESSNDYIKHLLTMEPPKEYDMNPNTYTDYSYYNKDYFNENFSRNYKLEEEKIYSNTSRQADTWANGSKYQIYPQHIPNYKAHVPGIYSSNIYGMGYSKSTAIAIKGDYCREAELPKEEKYKTTMKCFFEKPKGRVETEKVKQAVIIDPSSMNTNQKKIYTSKIANVPTPGYSGHTSLFAKPISYLNKDPASKNSTNDEFISSIEGLPENFKKALNTEDLSEDLPYICGYRGFRQSVKAQNYHGQNFRETSYQSRIANKINKLY